MAFYSYVILLLTHIGIGAVAHGEDSQRRALILSKRAQGEPGQWLQAKPRESPLPAVTGWGEGVLNLFIALTYHSSAEDTHTEMLALRPNCTQRSSCGM